MLCLSLGIGAQQPPASPPPGSAQEIMQSTPPAALMNLVINQELQVHDRGKFMYREWRKTPEDTKTKEIIETVDGAVALLLAVNDQPLTPEQHAGEDARLQKLLQDPNIQKQKEKEQKQDDERVRKMFRELPSAFLYQYAGTEAGPEGERIRLTFTPNPQWEPPSRETSVFRGMNGDVLVAVPELRLARMGATLFREITFGWGILGHLDKGGHFIVEQSKIGPQRWEATYMNVQFTGKALFFKNIDMREEERLSNFRPVPEGLSLAEGVERLKKSTEELAEAK
jgi:hypothetical protein